MQEFLQKSAYYPMTSLYKSAATLILLIFYPISATHFQYLSKNHTLSLYFN